MTTKELIEYFEHIRYQIVCYPAIGTPVLPTSVGSGFMLDYKGETLFVTADHVVNTHDKQVRRLDKYAAIQTNFISLDEKGQYGSILVTLGGIVFCTQLKVDFSSGAVTELPLFDGAFVLMNDFQKTAKYVTNEIELDGVHISIGEPKKHLDEACICTAKPDDEYFVYGRVRFKYLKGENGQIFLASQLIYHDGLKYDHNDGNYYVLKYPKPIVVDDWKGLSGSPVINHDGGLIGIACKVSDVTNEVWVKKIQAMMPLFDAEIMTQKLNAQASGDTETLTGD